MCVIIRGVLEIWAGVTLVVTGFVEVLACWVLGILGIGSGSHVFEFWTAVLSRLFTLVNMAESESPQPQTAGPQ